jgi:hypothetical protein
MVRSMGTNFGTLCNRTSLHVCVVTLDDSSSTKTCSEVICMYTQTHTHTHTYTGYFEIIPTELNGVFYITKLVKMFT